MEISLNFIDFALLGAIAFYFWRGWSKGFILSLVGPVSLILCFLYGFFYFKSTSNFLVGLLICLLGPMAINMIVSGLIATIKKAGKSDNKGGKEESEFLGRLAGGIFNIAWISLILFIMVIIISMIPFKIPGLANLGTAVKNSAVFSIISSGMGDRFSFLKKGVQPIDLEKAENYFPELKETSEYLDLMKDDRVKDLMNDPSIIKKIEEKDFVALLNNPKIQAIMNDPQLLRKFLILNKKMIEINGNTNKGEDNADDIYQDN
ncbi:MAG: CvpA family protein [Candidatus Omnitrophota bacterium]